MDFSQKKTLKSVSLNSRFLGTSPATLKGPPGTSLRIPAPVTPQTSATSKLKLTTSARPSLSLKLSRDQSASPASGTTSGTAGPPATSSTGQANAGASSALADSSTPGPAGARDAEKKPVWNTAGVPGGKSAKNYTDEELKAKHGISLVSRKSDRDTSKENRWDDSDEDDDWGDTIDFGDGVKMVVGKTATPTVDARGRHATPVAASQPSTRPAANAGRLLEPKVSAASANIAAKQTDLSGQPLNTLVPVPLPSGPKGPPVNPWRKPDAAPVPASVGTNTQEFPTPSSRPEPVTRASGDARMLLDESERGIDRRRRSSVIQQYREPSQATPVQSVEPETRYEYDTNDFDRKMQGTKSETREIFNSSTGKLEAIPVKAVRRMSERRTTRPSHGQDDVSRPVINGRADDSAVHTETAAQPEQPAPVELDPTSDEYRALQKKAMQEARERAIERRKQEEDEEVARKERARKKAAELAALAEQEDTQRKSVKPQGPPQILKPNRAAQAPAASTPETSAEGDRWQRRRLAAPVTAKGEAAKSPSEGSHMLSPESLSQQQQQQQQQQQPQGPQQQQQQQQAGFGAIGTRRAFDAQARTNEAASAQEKWLRQRGIQPEATWSAFNGISEQPAQPQSQSQQQQQYRGFAGEDTSASVPPKHPSPSQAQSSRTSSRFFPNPSAQTSPSKQPQSASVFEFGEAARTTQTGDVPPIFSLPDLSRPAEADAALFASGNRFEKPRLRIPRSSAHAAVSTAGSGVTKRGTHRVHIRELRSVDIQSRPHWEPKVPALPTSGSPSPGTPPTGSSSKTHHHHQHGPRVRIPIQARPPRLAPAGPVWNLPRGLEVESRPTGLTQPLVPPAPSLRLPPQGTHPSPAPEVLPTASSITPAPTPIHYATSRKPHHDSDLVSDRLGGNGDPFGAVRVKPSGDVAGVSVGRRFGRRDVGKAGTLSPKPKDVKRQPKNMADHGQGLTRGFASRQRKPQPSTPQSVQPTPS
ncbi:hypothetical protein PYCC9005_003618 [Savitreella phatthalungensis]